MFYKGDCLSIEGNSFSCNCSKSNFLTFALRLILILLFITLISIFCICYFHFHFFVFQFNSNRCRSFSFLQQTPQSNQIRSLVFSFNFTDFKSTNSGTNNFWPDPKRQSISVHADLDLRTKPQVREMLPIWFDETFNISSSFSKKKNYPLQSVLFSILLPGIDLVALLFWYESKK